MMTDQEQGPIASDLSLPIAFDENLQEDEANNRSTVPHSKWDVRHFKPLLTLGKGNYATVYLVESAQTGQLYAMKVRSKKFLQQTADLASLGTEKAVLLLAKRENHPFVVEVFGGFQTQSHIMLYLEFCPGGALMHHVKADGPFSTERARFYAAEVCLALKWFHGLDLLYRSLSLDDVLLGLDGHVKLVDFVVSEFDVRPGCKTKTFCGSAEFMPPEMLLDRPYDASVDWWQLGIITYQMLTGLSPFRGENEDEIYDSILADELPFPADLAMEAIDFIQHLLRKKPERRLGSGLDGASQVMAHAFFGEMDWDALYHKRVPAPSIPEAVHRADTSTFESEITLLDMQRIVDTPESLAPEIQELFRGFEFSAE